MSGPGSPGELFVEGERFNIQRFYQNQANTPLINQGRIFTPDVPFDPFNVRNLMLATIPSFITNPAAPIGPDLVMSSYPFPLSPQSVALAGQAMAANPQNANAILNSARQQSSEPLRTRRLLVLPPPPNGETVYRPVHSGHSARSRSKRARSEGDGESTQHEDASGWRNASPSRTRPRSTSCGRPSKTPTTRCIKRRSSIASSPIPRTSRPGLPRR